MKKVKKGYCQDSVRDIGKKTIDKNMQARSSNGDSKLVFINFYIDLEEKFFQHNSGRKEQQNPLTNLPYYYLPSSQPRTVATVVTTPETRPGSGWGPRVGNWSERDDDDEQKKKILP